MLEKPKRIADDEFQSAKWDEITRGRNFKPSDIPNIAMLCQCVYTLCNFGRFISKFS